MEENASGGPRVFQNGFRGDLWAVQPDLPTDAAILPPPGTQLHLLALASTSSLEVSELLQRLRLTAVSFPG